MNSYLCFTSIMLSFCKALYFLGVAMMFVTASSDAALSHDTIYTYHEPQMVYGGFNMIAAKLESPRFNDNPDSKKAINIVAKNLCKNFGHSDWTEWTTKMLPSATTIVVFRERFRSGVASVDYYARKSYGPPRVFNTLSCK